VDDLATVTRQLGRAPRAFNRVVARCPFGAPAVTEQLPYGPDGEPFPTMYYLTCRQLVAAIARLEAAGGVERWSAVAEENPELSRSLSEATAEQQALRLELAAGRTGSDAGSSLLTGIGGSRSPAALKCLHAHVAFALARPGYVLGDAILAEVPEPWPATCCSTETCAREV
jgi:hypothetical protein